MTKKKSKRIFQFILITASIGSLYFVPWLLVKAWILPLPDTVQEQLDQAIDHGFDGMIVFVDHGKSQMNILHRAGTTEILKPLPSLRRSLKSPVSVNSTMLWQ